MAELVSNVRRLRRSELFATLSGDVLTALAEIFELELVSAGDWVIHHSDETSRFFYVLVEGEAAVIRPGASDEEVQLAALGPGEVIGEMGFFLPDGAGEARGCSVRALTDCELLRAPYPIFATALKGIPSLAPGFLTALSRRLGASNSQFAETQIRLRKAERSLRDLSEFLDLSDANELGVGIEGLIERLVHTASNLLNAERGSLFLIDPHTGELWSKVAEGSEVKEIRVPARAGVVG